MHFKAINYTALSLIERTQSVKRPLNWSSPNTPFCTVLHQLWWKRVATRDPSVRSQRHSSPFQSALHLCTWSLLLCTQHYRHVHSHWSGVFKLKFDRISKKERKHQFLGAEKTGEAMWVNNLPKVATQRNSGRAGTQPRTSQLESQSMNHYTTEITNDNNK